jgi:hypothetical protein
MILYICAITNINILKVVGCKQMLKPVKIFYTLKMDEKPLFAGNVKYC